MGDSPEYERLLPHVKGNVGFVFTNGDLKTIRDKILANKVAAPARAGAIAPADVSPKHECVIISVVKQA